MADMQVITESHALADACQRLSEHPYVTIDTEFLRENTFWPQLCLIQIASASEALIVDPLAPAIDLAPFYALMADNSVIKVFHAARQDVEIVWYEADLIPTPLFDTQVAAMVCGFGDSVSYMNLVKKITGENIDKAARFTDWRKRPLSEKQLTYALADVTHLRAVYQTLADELTRTNRADWLSEEMATLTNPQTYLSRPEDAWRRLKMRVKNRRAMAVLMELAAWRERTAQSDNVPRNRVIKDDALYELANQAPRDAETIGNMRGVPDGFHRSARARGALAAIHDGLKRKLDDVPSPRTGRAMSAESAALLDLLKVLLKACAAEHRVAPKLIADSDDLERLALEDEANVPALGGCRYQVFGEQALKLKRGEIALSVKDGQVVPVAR
ncbi:MAG: ribonuclease D [Pseudomonadota bacterium]